MQPDHIPAPRGEVVEPEVLPSLEDAQRTRSAAPPGATAMPLGCTVGPGCGCIGLPLALLAGAVVTVFMALLWVLSLGRVPVSIVRMVQRLRQRQSRG
jgi:predicted lipid-binding transport protein (Tim44 family)